MNDSTITVTVGRLTGVRQEVILGEDRSIAAALAAANISIQPGQTVRVGNVEIQDVAMADRTSELSDGDQVMVMNSIKGA